MTASGSPSRIQKTLGWVLIALGIALFAIRVQHEGAYAMPRGAALLGGLGCLVSGGLLVSSVSSRALRYLALAAAPLVLFLALYSTMAEFEEVISLYATDSSGQPAELRLWIIDHEGAEWVGMPGSKAAEHALDGVPIQMLRDGTTRCVVPVLHEDRETVSAIHAMKVDKYAVAQAAAAIGLYPSQATETSVSLRLDPCPDEEEN